MALLEVSRVVKQEGDAELIGQLSFVQEPLQKLAIAGATGSGKTTLLKMIAGLLQPTSGAVFFEGERVPGPDEKLMPGHPGIAYLSQHFELRNHYRVEELVYRSGALSRKETESIARVCRIDHLLQRWTHQVSGGERQRIALACLLATAPRLLLLDEPFSNLDAIHKTLLKEVIDDIGAQLAITCLLVSHDAADTLSWADTILVLKEGKLIQQDKPLKIYLEPVNEYTAALFGPYNWLDPLFRQALTAARGEMPAHPCVRPGQFLLAGSPPGLPATVLQKRFMGPIWEMEIEAEGRLLLVHSLRDMYETGSTVYLSL